MSDLLLEVRDLATVFDTDAGEARAVDRVSFTVRRGEMLGLVGESGCGKTVTALSIMGLVPAPPARILSGSSIRLKGEEVVGATESRLRQLRGRVVSMVFQEPMSSLNPLLAVGAQIDEVLRWHLGLSAGAARKRSVELLNEVGIPDAADRRDAYPHQLSGGMRQRVLIAMALACEPDLLIADEPTAALDVTIQAQILDLLEQVRNQRGLSVLLITHDLGVVAQGCEQMVVMYAGQIVEQGEVREVFERPAHPYTRSLLDCIPRLDASGGPLRPIPGAVPLSTAWPAGCRFAPRCPRAFDRCSVEAPPLFRLEPSDAEDRRARCWLSSPD